MRNPIRRREFITLLGGAAAAWPLAASAQQATMPVIGWLNSQSPGTLVEPLRAFHEGLREAGFVEGRNVAIDYRWAEGQYERLPVMAADLVRRQVAVIATNGVAIVAAKAATTTIPIVFFAVAPDPVQAGLVASLNRPGGNITGVNSMNMELLPKRMELLHEVIPTATAMGYLTNPSNSRETALNLARPIVQDAARALGLQLHVVEASTDRDLDGAFEKLVELRAGGLVAGRGAWIGRGSVAESLFNPG
jgi:putative ABC transport system substrate-binding protein